MTQTVGASRDQIADELAIRAIVHRYADASSRRDPAGVASVFAADGEWHSPAMGTYKGRDAVASFFAEMLQDCRAFIQGLQSGVVVPSTTDLDRAIGRWFIEETGQRSDGTTLTVAGVYHDKYVRQESTWRISHRRYDPLLIRTDDSVAALSYPTDVQAVD